MFINGLRFLRAVWGMKDPRKWGLFQEIYRLTKFDAEFTPSWSQAGEDICVNFILSGFQGNKFYLDIGAHDPNRFSVTRKLYDLGWQGIDVDGNPGYEKIFKRFRPRNYFLNICVGPEKNYSLSIFGEGAISSTNQTWIQNFENDGFHIKEIVSIRGMKLRDLIELPSVPNRIGFMNIDIEGADEDALRSIEFETLPIDRYPHWILLETAPPVESALDFPAVKYAIEHGYTPWLILPMATLLKAPEKKR